MKVLGGGRLKNSACTRVESVAPVKPARTSSGLLYGCPLRVTGCEAKSTQAGDRGPIHVLSSLGAIIDTSRSRNKSHCVAVSALSVKNTRPFPIALKPIPNRQEINPMRATFRAILCSRIRGQSRIVTAAHKAALSLQCREHEPRRLFRADALKVNWSKLLFADNKTGQALLCLRLFSPDWSVNEIDWSRCQPVVLLGVRTSRHTNRE